MAELEQIGIIGLGLIGGSIAAGLKRVGGYEIRAFDADPDATKAGLAMGCLLYTSPSPRDATLSRMPSSA